MQLLGRGKCECAAGDGTLLTAWPQLGSLRALLRLRKLSVNPGEGLAWFKGNLIQILSKMKLSWTETDGWGKSHKISLNLSKADSKVSSVYV